MRSCILITWRSWRIKAVCFEFNYWEVIWSFSAKTKMSSIRRTVGWPDSCSNGKIRGWWGQHEWNRMSIALASCVKPSYFLCALPVCQLPTHGIITLHQGTLCNELKVLIGGLKYGPGIKNLVNDILHKWHRDLFLNHEKKKANNVLLGFTWVNFPKETREWLNEVNVKRMSVPHF